MNENSNTSVENMAEIYKKLNEQGRLLVYSNATTLLVQQQMQESRIKLEKIG